MKMRVTEERLTITEVSYDVDVPEGTDPTEVEEFLDRENDEVARAITVSHSEITNTEVLDG